MTDSLKERLRLWEATAATEHGRKTLSEALARIEELEAKAFRVSTVAGEQQLTIAKLEAENKRLNIVLDEKFYQITDVEDSLRDTKTLLAGQSARIIDLELAVSHLGEELKEKTEALKNLSDNALKDAQAEIERLKQESNYWQMAAMHANEREEEAQADRLKKEKHT